MICGYQTKPEEAVQLSTLYNCIVISETQIIKCIFRNDDAGDGAAPIMAPLSLNEFDLAVQPYTFHSILD